MSGIFSSVDVRSLSWVRERVAYSADTICELFGVPLSEKATLIADLLTKRIINRRGIAQVDDAEPLEGYITGADYSFCFIGIYCREGNMVCILPKYADAESLRIPEQGDFHRPCPAARRALFAQVLKAIRRYKHSAQHDLPEWQQDSADSHQLSLMVTLLSDFVENGVYRDVRKVESLNEKGRVLWHSTIHKTSAILQQDAPVYPDVVTRQTKHAPRHPITLLHRRIAEECYHCLHHLGLVELLGLPEPDADESENDTYDTAYMLYLVESELNVQFDSRRRYILLLLREYLLKQSSADEEQVSEYAFGCSSFNLLWEDACRRVLGQDFSRLWSILPPDWVFPDRMATAAKSLEPDIIVQDEEATYIVDAKYYLPMDSVSGMPSGLPGIESVTKQFLYRQAMLTPSAVEMRKGRILSPVYNAFVMPAPQSCPASVNGVSYYAKVTMPLFGESEIVVLTLSPERLFACYADNVHSPYLRESILRSIRLHSSAAL